MRVFNRPYSRRLHLRRAWVGTKGATIAIDSAVVTLALTPSSTDAAGFVEAPLVFPTSEVIDDLVGGLPGIFTTPATSFGDTGTVNSDGSGAYPSAAATPSTTYLNDRVIGPDVEAYITVDVLPATNGNQQVMVRVQNPTGSVDAYIARAYVGTGTGIEIRKKIGGGASSLIASSSTIAWAAGDKFGISVIGNLLQAWYIPVSTGIPSVVASEFDSSITAAGYVAFTVADNSSTTVRLKNFGAGSVQSVVYMSITPSGSDTLVPPAIEYTDSVTATLTLTPSATDTAQRVDTGTVSLSLTPSESDIAQFVDAGTASLALTPSVSDVAIFVDSNTVGMFITPSSTDVRIITDAATVSFVVTPSSSDIAQFVDSATTTIALTPSATDLHTTTDAGTVSFVVIPSTVDTAQFVDASTASILITASSSDTGQLVDSNIASVIITPSETDVLAAIDSSTVSLVLTVTSSDIFVATDSATIPLILSVASTDVAEFIDTGSAYLGIVASSIDIRERFDSNIIEMTLTPSVNDAEQFVDTGDINVLLTPSSTDVREELDEATVSFVLSPSSSDSLVAVDEDSANLTLTVSSVDIYTQTGDFATATITLTPSSSDAADFVDTGSVVVVVDLSGIDVTERVDSSTVTVTLTPSVIDAKLNVDSATVTLNITLSSTDSQSESLNTSQISTQTIDESIHILLVPVSDIVTGTWHNTPLYEKVDEFTPDPSDYIQSGENPVNDIAELALSPGNDPVASSDHFINIQFYKNEAAPSVIDLTVRLKEGSTIISEQVLSDIPNTLTTLKISLTSGEIDSISDYANLSFELIANEVP